MLTIETGETATTLEPVTAANVTLNNCDREQIQLVGAIQPHGVLLVLEEGSLRILQASENCGDFLNMPWENLVGNNIDVLLGDENGKTLRTELAVKNIHKAMAHVLTLPSLSCYDQALHVFANSINGVVLLELERTDPTFQTASAVLYDLREAMQSFQSSSSLQIFLDRAVAQIRDFSGFERVMAYRFAADGSGEVIAEAKLEELESYLSLHYPASDIPAPARRLFALSPLRHLPDVDYTPVPLLPADTIASVDLSYVNLRSVSVMYTDYLRNMGVKATLVMPLFKAGELWGLISCMQHSSPLYLPFERRIPLEFLSQMVSQLSESREGLDQLEYRKRLDNVHEQLVFKMTKADSLNQALMQEETNLLSGIDASGVALLADANLTLLGKTPSPKEIGNVVEWLARQQEDVFATHTLGVDFSDSLQFSDESRGLLAVRLSRKSKDWLIWFRSELVSEVHWAGDPGKPMEIDETNGEIILKPRASFARWKESVHGQSRPWLACELDYAARLRHSIFGMIVERAWLLAQMNAELERSNLELDAFAYASSHDMKEPLRGIHNYAEFLKMEESGRLSETGRLRLDTILRLTERMADLLDSLLQYSRIGKNKLERHPCAINDLVYPCIKLIKETWPDKNISIEIRGNLPVIDCDRVWISTVFQNLITNAVKYNQQPDVKIEIGCDETCSPPVFYVRDNGIGIGQEHQNSIFELFHRLHGRNEYGGGSGAGLTIVRRVIERHGGQIWLKSELGQGSTFFFTLSPANHVRSIHHGEI